MKKDFVLLTILKENRRLIAFLLLAFLFNVQSNAQTRSEWQFLKEEKNVKLYYMLSTCGAQEKLLIKAENASNKKVITHLSVEVNDGGLIRRLPLSQMEIKPKESVYSDCKGNRAPNRFISYAAKHPDNFMCTVKRMIVHSTKP